MDAFEKHIKAAVENHKVDYNPNHWKKVEAELNKKRAARNARYAAGGALLLLISASLLWIESEPVTHKPQPVQQIQPEVNTPDVEPTTTTKPVEVQEHTPTNNVVESPGQKENTSPEPVSADETMAEDLPTPEVPEQEKTPVSTAASLNIAASADRYSGCTGDWVKFGVDVNIPATVTWHFGDGTTSNQPEPTHRYKTPGIYNVAVEVTSLLDGNSKKSVLDGPVIINPRPIAEFDYDLVQTQHFTQEIQLTNLTQKSLLSEWIINGEQARGREVSGELNLKGDYPVTLIVKNEAGCYDTLHKIITVNQDYNLLAPNAFTPNNDGQNDKFIPRALEKGEHEFNMQIVSTRSGQVIFETKSYSQPWDGTDITSGKIADPGLYAWIVQVRLANGESKTFKGEVRLLE